MLNKAIFLDRDGVINHENGYTTSLSEFKILPDVLLNLKKWQELGYLLFIISNQGGISKGLFTQQELEKMHTFFLDESKKAGVSISEIYYCMHHPQSNSGKCICRKPDSVMLEKAIARFSIDPKQSYFIGDKDTDMQAAQKAGIKGILVPINDSLNKINIH
ncbi:MAG: HAD family hydrolase [Bacteroidetes bacterium]|nr:HAD family hydrolase [Bacteroidota bacterium]